MKISKSLLVAFLCFPLVALAQQNTISPYSSFGIGEFQSQGFALNNDLGGLGIALRSNNQLNLLNPASSSALTLTSFEVGVRGSALFLKDANFEQEAFSSTMAYLSLGFPIAKGVGVSGGLLPYSFKGYQLSQNSIWSDGVDTLETTIDYIGSGGLNRAFLNFGAELADGLSVGVTGNVIFGTLTQQRDLRSDALNFINRRDENLYTVKDFSFDFGVQYQTNIKDKQLIFGATYTPQASLDASNNGAIYTYNIVNNFEYIRDTVSVDDRNSNGLILPAAFGAGLSLGKENKWFVSGEYEFKEWSQLSLFESPNANLQNASQFKVGAWIIPNDKDVHKYWKSIQYRMGVNYNTGYLAISELGQNATQTNLNDLSLSLGFGLPLKRSNTIANIGVQFGKRGTIESNLVEEKYIKFHLAFTFNDKWFTKRKID
tara:strand:- start:14775 stop:16064 length:1290 start_codon:yes stop_codon:yes gene_type:complete